jgi:hypothetical protein
MKFLTLISVLALSAAVYAAPTPNNSPAPSSSAAAAAINGNAVNSANTDTAELTLRNSLKSVWDKLKVIFNKPVPPN